GALLRQRDALADRAGARVARLDPDLGSGRRFDDPLELREVGRRLVVPPPGRGALLDAASELAGRRLHLAADEPRIVRQLQPGLALRAPELRGPREDAEVVVHPVVRAALDRLLRVVLEVMEDRHGGVARQLGPALADDLVRTEVDRREVLIGPPGIRAKVNAA